MSDGRPDAGQRSTADPATTESSAVDESAANVADDADSRGVDDQGTSADDSDSEIVDGDPDSGHAHDELDLDLVDDEPDPSPVDDEPDPNTDAVDTVTGAEAFADGTAVGTPVDEVIRTQTTTVEEETTTDADGRWFAGLLLALAAGAAGVFLSNTGVFLAAIVGLVYAGYASLSRPPSAPLVVERTVTPASPKPGDRLTVTVRAENVGSTVLPDVRVADAPPDGLDVVDGDTRGADTVEPGETVTLRYRLRASRGRHEFGDVVVVARGASGAGVRRTVYDAAESLVCHAPFESIPLAGQTGIGSGRVETDTGGEGVEFYSTREYAQGDPANRVDWNRYAATGELTTVTYRESRAATVVFVVDGRFDKRRAPGEPTARELCSYAAVRAADASLDAQNQVGAAVFDGFASGGLGARGALEPGTGTEQSLRIRSLLGRTFGVTVDDLSVSAAESTGSDSENGESRRRSSAAGTPLSGRASGLLDWLPGGAQVVFVSPLLDDTAVRAVEQLAAHDHATTVLSPDQTDDATPGATVERVRRDARVHSLVGIGQVRVVDWSPAEPLQAAVDRASARWER